MQYFNYILNHYSWSGLTLIFILFTVFFVQIYYYAILYKKVAKYRNSKRKKKLQTPPPISIVIPLMSEDYGFIRERLPRFLGQHYESSYEVVIIFIGTNGDFYEELETMRLQYPALRVAKLEYNPRFKISPKQAINLGIKSAFNEHIIVSTNYAAPVHEEWLSMMGKGFMRGEIVLGYSAIETTSGIANYLIRMSRLYNATHWLYAATLGKTYNSSRSNFGLTKQIYFEANGFSHLNMNIGENDLFLQTIATKKNVSVVMTPKAVIEERQWGGLGWWLSQLRYYGSAYRLYPTEAQNTYEWNLRTHILFFLTALATIIFMPLEIKALALILVIIRWIIVLQNTKAIAKRLGERVSIIRHTLFDIINPWMVLYLRIKLIRKDRRAWR